MDYEIEERLPLMYRMPECEISSDSEMRIFSLAKHNAEPQSLKLKIPKIFKSKNTKLNKNKKFKKKKLSKSSLLDLRDYSSNSKTKNNREHRSTSESLRLTKSHLDEK